MEQGDDGGKRWGIIGRGIVGLDKAKCHNGKGRG